MNGYVLKDGDAHFDPNGYFAAAAARTGTVQAGLDQLHELLAVTRIQGGIGLYLLRSHYWVG